MKLSIIIPSFNTEKLLGDCLKSILAETKNFDYEIIIVDNGSNYNIKGQIAEFLRNTSDKEKQKNLKISLILNKKNLGFAKACNQGIEKSRGEYLLFLNSDTLILDRAIEKAIGIIEKDKRIGIFGCKLLNSDKTIQPSAGFFPKLRQILMMMLFWDDLPIINLLVKPYHQQNPKFYGKAQEVDWVTGAFLLTRRQVIDQIGGFDEDYFMYAEEVDFCYRAKKAKFKILYNPEPEVIHYKEASPRDYKRQKAILAEYQGLMTFFKKHKPAWELPILKILLRTGALIRIFVFGILLGDEQKRKAYSQAFFLA